MGAKSSRPKSAKMSTEGTQNSRKQMIEEIFGNLVKNTMEGARYFHGSLPQSEAEMLLQKNGQFLVRIQDKDAILSVQWQDKPRHIVINNDDDLNLWRIESLNFPTIPRLIEVHLISGEPIARNLLGDCRIQQPIEREVWELNKDDVVYNNKMELGKGNFSHVYLGKFKKTREVAVKEPLEKLLRIEQRLDIREEARLLHRVSGHPNVVEFIGARPWGDPAILVMEAIDGSDLREFLLREGIVTSTNEKLHFCLDIATGMEHINGRGIVHRDLAARNCLITTKNKRIKIGDFGLAREYPYEAEDRKTPLAVKWCPPETLDGGQCLDKSDLWSFGIVTWEIFANGREPWVHLPTSDAVMNHVKKYGAKNLRPPEGMVNPSAVELMRSCLEKQPSERPSFTAVRLELIRILADTEHRSR